MSKVLTTAAVIKFRPTNKRREIADAGCAGLYLLIQPSGSKSFAYRYRRPNGQSVKLWLGPLFDGEEIEENPEIGDPLTLKAAHELVASLRRKLARGRDPADEHKRQREEDRRAKQEAGANTFLKAAHDFISQHAQVKVRRWKPLARLLGLNPLTLQPFPRGLADRWGDRPVAEIDGHDIHSLIDECRKFGVPGIQKRTEGNSEARARKMFGCLSKLFSWLIRDRRVGVNPCSSVARPEVPKARDRVLTNQEIAQLWKAAETIGAHGTVIKLLLLTGCRLQEVTGMRWSELEGSQWLIPGERTKNHRAHIVPLSKLAQDLITGTKRIAGSQFIFTTNGNSPVTAWSWIKDRLDDLMKPARPWVIHDLRRTCATGMADLGILPHIIEATLNHISGARSGVAGVYNRSLYTAEKCAALERWAAHVEGLVSGKPANVTPLRRV